LTVCPLLEIENVGNREWWEALKRLGMPLITPGEKEALVDFFWRDPEGSELISSTSQVLLEVNSITDHHSWEPVSLTRIVGTDVWHHRLLIEMKWSGSYSFIPLKEHQRPELAKMQLGHCSISQRQWYMSVMHQAEVDFCNPLPFVVASRGLNGSALHMPEADQEKAWQRWDQGSLPSVSYNFVTSFEWASQTLNNKRRVWYFETGDRMTKGTKPLVLLLDGQHWTTPSGTPSVLKYLTEQDVISPAIYLLVDSINIEVRWQELSCYAPFWKAMFNELLPLVVNQYQLPIIGNNILVAGQSLGGLSSMYAGLYWPQYVNRVVSLSGSFWWPDVDRLEAPRTDMLPDTPRGSLAEALQLGQLTSDHLRVFQSVGSYEGDMNRYNDSMAESLEKAGGSVNYQRFCGGHDWLAWRTSLIKGLKALQCAD